jgi:hypothetical protein
VVVREAQQSEGLGSGGGEEVTEAEIEATKASLCLSLQVRECLHYVNPPHLKSIPEIDHVHILLHLSSSLLFADLYDDCMVILS